MQGPSSKPTNNQNIQDSLTAEKIELLIQQKYSVTIPSIVFEFLSTENLDFEVNDLKSLYSQFGEIDDFAIKGKLSIVLYKTFFSAECFKEYIKNEKNFKENMKKIFLV